MKNYYEALDEDLFDSVPITFHIKEIKDDEFNKFQAFYNKSKKKLEKGKKKNSSEQIEKSPFYQSQAPPKNIWIIKPGENTNQGRGI